MGRKWLLKGKGSFVRYSEEAVRKAVTKNSRECASGQACLKRIEAYEDISDLKLYVVDLVGNQPYADKD